MVRLGRKWLSITSTWIRSAPASRAASISRPRLAKSAERMEGAMRTGCCGMVVSGTRPRRRVPAFAPEGIGRKGAERLELLGEKGEFLERELEAALLGMALDLGIELRLLEMRAGEIAFQLDDIDAGGGEPAQRLVERGRHARHPRQERAHA